MAALLCLLLVPALLGVPADKAKDFSDRGSFRILSSGQLIGTERFEIETAPNGYRFYGEIRVKVPGSGEAQETATLMLNRDLEATTYERAKKSPKKGSLTVKFGADGAQAHSRAPEGESNYTYYLDRKVVVLDTNFFHHYAFLVERYQMEKGGAQQINVFVPQEGAPGVVVLEYLGKDEGLSKWMASTDVLQMLLWTDEARHLVKLTVPAAKVEVVREAK